MYVGFRVFVWVALPPTIVMPSLLYILASYGGVDGDKSDGNATNRVPKKVRMPGKKSRISISELREKSIYLPNSYLSGCIVSPPPIVYYPRQYCC